MVKEKFVICYYGTVIKRFYADGDWKEIELKDQIVYTSEPFDSMPTLEDIKINKIGNAEYAKIEKRYYFEGN